MSSRAVASSSMTRTRSAVGERRPSEPVELLACASALPGRRTVNTEPLPGSLVTVTSPPIMRASLREMASPDSDEHYRSKNWFRISATLSDESSVCDIDRPISQNELYHGVPLLEEWPAAVAVDPLSSSWQQA